MSKLVGLFAGNINTGISSYLVSEIYVLERSSQKATGNNHLINETSLKTDAQMKTEQTYSGFNFGGIWDIATGEYPKFIKADALTIVVNNSKVNYYIGEKIEVAYVKLNVNGAEISLFADMLKQYDTSKSGMKTITGEYRGKSFSFDINVKEPLNVTKLEIEKFPRLQYTESEVFDPTGLVFNATIDGIQYRKIYSGYTWDKTGPLTIADNKIIFTYGGMTVSADLTVTGKMPKEVVLLSAPSKTNYYSGERLKLDGLILQIVYTDGTKSNSFTKAEFTKYGINLAKSNGVNLVPISENAVINVEDNNLGIFAFAGNVEAGNYANKRITTLKVTKAMKLDKQNITLTQNRDNYEFTDAISDGSGNFEAKLKSGTIPTNVKVSFNGSAFMITGKPAQIQDAKLIYEVRDLLTGQILNAEINISVKAVSKEANFLSFSLLKSWNSSLPSDINGVINANEVLLYIPESVNTKRFKISYTISRGATTVQNQWNGSEIDFTNPVKFVITAEDGITKKEYIVKIVKTKPTVETKIEIKKYKVNGNNQISYIGQKVKVSDFLKNVVVSSNLYVEVQTVANGQEFIGTNTKINIKDRTSKALVRQYECLVYGDVNGDGKISAMDYTLIKNHIMDVKKITDKNMKLTADVNGDGKISAMDYTLIKNDIMDVKKLPLK